MYPEQREAPEDYTAVQNFTNANDFGFYPNRDYSVDDIFKSSQEHHEEEDHDLTSKFIKDIFTTSNEYSESSTQPQEEEEDLSSDFILKTSNDSSQSSPLPQEELGEII